jgi:hypothetical protein
MDGNEPCPGGSSYYFYFIKNQLVGQITQRLTEN